MVDLSSDAIELTPVAYTAPTEQEQRKAHKGWVEKEGGIEHPTHIFTLDRLEQKERIRWLIDHCEGTVIDIGCNWGFVSNEMGASMGIDINPENIKYAKGAFPRIRFCIGDIIQGLAFPDGAYDTVVLADILEHLDWQLVDFAVVEASRICRRKVLITLPWKPTRKFAYCFKHKWIPGTNHIGHIVQMLMYGKVSVQSDMNFVYMEALK